MAVGEGHMDAKTFTDFLTPIVGMGTAIVGFGSAVIGITSTSIIDRSGTRFDSSATLLRPSSRLFDWIILLNGWPRRFDFAAFMIRSEKWAPGRKLRTQRLP